MNNTNYIGIIVKILELPIKMFNNSNISMAEFRVQLPQTRNTSIVKLIFWGNLANDIGTYYKPNDYIIVEGYISSINNQYNKLLFQNIEKVEITVLKVYPFLLSYD